MGRNLVKRASELGHGEGQKRRHPLKELGTNQGMRVKHPKDFVVLMGNRLIDGKRMFTFTQALPSELPMGMSVVYHSDKGDPVVQVIKDYGEEVMVLIPATTEGEQATQAMVARAKLGLLPFPAKPTLVHKRDLHKYIGAKAAAAFWDSKLRLRVPAANTKAKTAK